MILVPGDFLMASALNIALTGLNDAAARIANATTNIVNASSISPLPQIADNYSGYVPQDTVTLSQDAGGNSLGVTTATEPQNNPYVTSYDPNAPQANAQGLVAQPNVDLATQLVNINVSQVNYRAHQDQPKDGTIAA
jgi:flagellar basal-body rod protein FlgC